MNKFLIDFYGFGDIHNPKEVPFLPKIIINDIDKLKDKKGNDNQIIYVYDSLRSGFFKYNKDLANYDDNCTIIKGWERIYNGHINIEWRLGYNNEDLGLAVTKMARLMRMHSEYYRSKTIYIPKGDYLLTYPITLSQGVSLQGEGYFTKLICDFSDEFINDPSSFYKNYGNLFGTFDNKHVHYTCSLDNPPMISNWWMTNYQSIKDIRLDGNNKNVKAIWLNEVYYSQFENINIRNFKDSGFTIIRGQFNSIENLSVINSSAVRFICCCTLSVDGLDIEGSISPQNQLEIVHDSKWKQAISLTNFHLEEASSGVYNDGDAFLISQEGVSIYSMFATYNNHNKDNRNFHISAGMKYTFDNCTINTVDANNFLINDGSTGSGMDFLVDDGLKKVFINGTASERVKYSNISRNTEVSLNNKMLSSGFKVISNSSPKLKTLWCSSDTKINLGNNPNRYLDFGNGSSLDVVNSYGRLNIKAGSVLPDINLEANTHTFKDIDSNTIMKIGKETIEHSGIIDYQHKEKQVSEQFLSFKNKDNITLKNLKLTTSHKYNTIVFKNCSNITIDNVEISTIYENVWRDTFSEEGSDDEFQFMRTTAILIINSFNIRIKNSKFNKIPGVGIVVDNCSNVNVDSCTFRDMGGNCFNSINNGEKDLSFTNNFVYGCYDSFVGVHLADNVIISNNVLHKTSDLRKVNTGYGIDIPGASNAIVSNNTITGNGTQSDEYTGIGIHIHGYLNKSGENIIVSNNIISGVNIGLQVGEGTSIIKVQSNIFTKNNIGIRVGDSKNLDISSNIINESNVSIDAWSNTRVVNLKIHDNTLETKKGLSVGPNTINTKVYNNDIIELEESGSISKSKEVYLRNNKNGELNETIYLEAKEELEKCPINAKRYIVKNTDEELEYIFDSELTEDDDDGDNYIFNNSGCFKKV